MSNRALTAVFQHSESKGSARLVLLAMADEANDQGLLTAYRRSHSWLARKANVDEGTVRRAIRALEEAGEVETLTRGDGRASSNYRLLLPELEPIEGGRDAPPAQASGAPREGERRAQGGRGAPPINPLSPDTPSENPTRAPSESLRLLSAEDPGPTFVAFWSAYPRGDGKPAAVRAWEKAIKAAAPERIMEGLAAWLAYWQARNEPEFIPWAQKWLNQQQWAAAPPPLRRGQGQRAPVGEAWDRSRESRVLEL